MIYLIPETSFPLEFAGHVIYMLSRWCCSMSYFKMFPSTTEEFIDRHEPCKNLYKSASTCGPDPKGRPSLVWTEFPFGPASSGNWCYGLPQSCLAECVLMSFICLGTNKLTMILLWIFFLVTLVHKKKMQLALLACFLWYEEINVSWYLKDLWLKKITSSPPFLLYWSCLGG